MYTWVIATDDADAHPPAGLRVQLCDDFAELVAEVAAFFAGERDRGAAKDEAPQRAAVAVLAGIAKALAAGATDTGETHASLAGAVRVLADGRRWGVAGPYGYLTPAGTGQIAADAYATFRERVLARRQWDGASASPIAGVRSAAKALAAGAGRVLGVSQRVDVVDGAGEDRVTLRVEHPCAQGAAWTELTVGFDGRFRCCVNGNFASDCDAADQAARWLARELAGHVDPRLPW